MINWFSELTLRDTSVLSIKKGFRWPVKGIFWTKFYTDLSLYSAQKLCPILHDRSGCGMIYCIKVVAFSDAQNDVSGIVMGGAGPQGVPNGDTIGSILRKKLQHHMTASPHLLNPKRIFKAKRWWILPELVWYSRSVCLLWIQITLARFYFVILSNKLGEWRNFPKLCTNLSLWDII